MLFPAPVDLLFLPELLEQVLRVFTLAAEAIDFHALVLQLCPLLGLLLRALFALLSGHGSAAERGPRARQGVWGPQRKPRGQVSDHQRRGEAPQYPRQLHPVAEASEFATTRRFSKPTRRLITPEDFKKRDEVLKLFIKKSMGFRLNQLDTLSELSLNEDILRAFGESSLAEARPEAREPIQRRRLPPVPNSKCFPRRRSLVFVLFCTHRACCARCCNPRHTDQYNDHELQIVLFTKTEASL